MKYLHLFFLCTTSLSLLANHKPQTNPTHESDPEIDRIWRRHQEQQAEVNQFHSNSANIEKLQNKFSPEFINILLKAAPKQLKEKLHMLKSSECPADRKPKLLLLYGPSGSGKTTLAELLAQQTGRKYIRIQASNLGSEFVNSAQSNFKKAIEPHLDSPCVIVIDEIDAVIKEASSPHDPERKVPQKFWTMLDELALNPNVIIIGTTNDISNLPSQLKTRLADSLIEVPDAKQEIKKEVLAYYLKQCSNNCDDKCLNKMANNCKKLSIREIEKAVNLAWQKAFIRNSSMLQISLKDMEEAITELKKTASLMKKQEESAIKNGLKTVGQSGLKSLGATIAVSVGCLALEYYGIPCLGKK